MSQNDKIVVERNFNHSLGIGSMVLGVLASVLLFLPSLPLNAIASAIFALVIAFVGVVLAIVGLSQSIRRNGEGIGYPIVGLTLNGIPTALCLLAIWAIVSAQMEIAAQAKREAEREQQRIAQVAAENRRIAEEQKRLEEAREIQLAQERTRLEEKRRHAEAEAKKLEAEAKLLAEENTKQAAIDRKRREEEEAIARQKQLEENRILEEKLAAQKLEEAKKLTAQRKAQAQEKTIEYGKLLAKFIKANNDKPPHKFEELFFSKVIKNSKLEALLDMDPWGNSYRLGQKASSTPGKALFYVFTVNPDSQEKITADQGTLGLIDIDKMVIAAKDVSELSSPLWEYMAQNNKRAPKSIDELKPFIKNTTLKDPWGKPYRIGTKNLGAAGIMHYVYALHPDGKTEIQGIGSPGTNSED